MNFLQRMWAVIVSFWSVFRKFYRSITGFLPSRKAEKRHVEWVVENLEHIIVGVFHHNFPECLFSLNSDKTVPIRHPSGKKYTTRSFDDASTIMVDVCLLEGVIVMNDILDEARQQFSHFSGIPEKPTYF